MKIGFCTSDEIQQVMRFFGEHWAPNHILSTSKALVDWQHYDRQSGRYNFVIAVDQSGSIAGVLGFIPTSHFDPQLRDQDALWLTSWKVREFDAPPGLGLRLHSFIERNVPHLTIGTVGNNEHAGKIYQALGYTTGRMSQFYAVNCAKTSFELCDLPLRASAAPAADQEPTKLIRLDSSGVRETAAKIRYVQPADVLPRKSPEYFVNRFLRHPVYDYRLYTVVIDGRPGGLLALRCAQAGGQRAIRVVDYYGDPSALATLSAAWQQLMQEFDAEYIDMYCHGALEDPLRKGGMTLLDPAGQTVIPNHFEPFVKKNVIINWAYKSPPGTRHQVVKADADQDRPNLVQQK